MLTKFVPASPSIEAVQWTGENLSQVGELARHLADVMQTAGHLLRVRPIEVTAPEIDVVLGAWLVRSGDHLVVLPAESFAALFEPAEPSDPDGGSAGDPVATPRVDALAETFAFEGGFD